MNAIIALVADQCDIRDLARDTDIHDQSELCHECHLSDIHDCWNNRGIHDLTDIRDFSDIRNIRVNQDIHDFRDNRDNHQECDLVIN